MVNFLKRILGMDEIEARLRRLESFAANAEDHFKGVAQLMPLIREMDQETFDRVGESSQLDGRTIYLVSQKKDGD